MIRSQGIHSQKGLFLFRRDLRLEDNTALMRAARECREVIAAFIFDPAQTEDHPYRSENALEFMIQSLEDLSEELKARGGKLYFFRGQPAEIVKKLIQKEKVEALYLNRDYTPFSLARDAALEKICKAEGAAFFSEADLLLHDAGTVAKDDGKPYTVFTPYYRKAKEIPIARSQKNSHRNFYRRTISFEEPGFKNILKHSNPRLFPEGGRKNALRILKRLSDFENYARERDFPAIAKTTGLSAHLKFGTCSVREVYSSIQEKLGTSHPLAREIHWRDFFTQIAFHFPRVFGHSFRERYDNIRWRNDAKQFAAWREGRTGFPFIDAGMRQLNATGFMHNRLRMAAASFLVKDLKVDWRWGEKYFAQKLTDYDPCVNNGNWQWAASTGCDAQPYFRIFNPWLQGKRFDAEGDYIKKWVPELKGRKAKELHEERRETALGDYPKPIVNHRAESVQAKIMFQTVRK